MIYTIGNQTLEISDTESKERKGSPNQVVGWADMAATCRTLYAVCKEIKLNQYVTIADGIARSGFWGKLFRHVWPDCALILNEKDLACKPVLERNFPDDIISHFNEREWAPDECHLAMLDFDDFTLRKIHKYLDILVKWSEVTPRLIFVDSTCFGFKFGNLKHYGVKNEIEYFHLLDDTLFESFNKRITVISKFTNAATILLENRRRGDIKFVPPSSDLVVSRGYEKSLF